MLFYVAVMFLTLKTLTLLMTKEMSWANAVLYTGGWIGMNPDEFKTEAHSPHNWRSGTVSVLIGLIIFYLSLKQVDITLRAVYLFIAMIFIFHFGLLDLNAQLWNFLGRKTKPIMNEPWKALNLADFWGKRWNMAFRDAAHRTLFLPLKRFYGAKIAILGVFIFSGLVHEAVISLPAQGGYGGPMVYFLIQFLGLILQKEFRLLNNRWVTWIFLIIPLPLLFHKAFFLNVFIPLSNAIGG